MEEIRVEYSTVECSRVRQSILKYIRVYLDGPSLLTAHQLEVLAKVGAVAQETHFDNLDGEDTLLGQVRRRRHIQGTRGAAGSHAPPGQGAGVSRHRTNAPRHTNKACTPPLLGSRHRRRCQQTQVHHFPSVALISMQSCQHMEAGEGEDRRWTQQSSCDPTRLGSLS